MKNIIRKIINKLKIQKMKNFISEKFRSNLWENKIPVIITLALDEINGIDKPPNLLVIFY